MDRISLKMGPIFHGVYKGLEVYEEFIPMYGGYDPAPYIWYAKPSGNKKIKWTVIAYSEEELKNQIDNMDKRVLRRKKLEKKLEKRRYK